MGRGKLTGKTIALGLFWGAMIGGIGPLLYPPVAQVAQPIVCPGGSLSHEVVTVQTSGGISANAFYQCTREGGSARDISFLTGLTMVGIAIAIVFLFLFIRSRRAARPRHYDR